MTVDDALNTRYRQYMTIVLLVAAAGGASLSIWGMFANWRKDKATIAPVDPMAATYARAEAYAVLLQFALDRRPTAVPFTVAEAHSVLSSKGRSLTDFDIEDWSRGVSKTVQALRDVLPFVDPLPEIGIEAWLHSQTRARGFDAHPSAMTEAQKRHIATGGKRPQ